MDILELFKITSYVSGHFLNDPQKLEGLRPNPSVAEKWCLGQWAVFFGFVCDLPTAQCLENRPTAIPGACICVIVLPQSPSEMTDTHIEQHKRTGLDLFCRNLEGLGASGMGALTCWQLSRSLASLKEKCREERQPKWSRVSRS